MIETVAEIGSTNAALLGRLAAGESVPEGAWLVADRQSAGRGRAGRTWSDGFGNFMGSTAALLRAGDPLPQTLALVAGVAAHKAVLALCDGLSGLMLKWPNDLLVGQAKLAGILLERQGDGVVVGIGVNLAQAPEVPGRATASLAGLGFPVARDAFAATLAAEWQAALTRWHCGEWPALREEWLARAHPVGTLVTVKDTDQGTIMGAFGGIDDNGVALLRLADGATRAIHAGDIEMVG
ncbi:biotin--[acetyl-CoA-carboxylase] ligase [Novosphingobium sp. KCTC 2891]|uniref:biotin--[acetyl-CoA-carboxylase] ligase n=1 Tax=Novosphingobium sp. KCTC 2891 TaxID=2989730 RepID=UPI002221D423|nr:biotin--[acetyl-CoA-carboxylase] ligase [Novosphingobium sp. KCTC 2891]MCW1381745.1 biotin--[acetyl-CoA-carboxylase] ligase [Novosphingobium sp. KCTC 2891]